MEKAEVKRKAGRPKSEPTEVIRIRLPLPVHAKVIERGGDKWVKRLINEAIERDKPTQDAHDRSAEWVAPYKGGWTGRRHVEFQADGSYILRDSVTMEAYSDSTGEQIEQHK